jgi:chaperonin GroES
MKHESAGEPLEVSGFPLRLLGDHVAVSRDQEPEFTAGGLYLPPGARATPTKGTVIAIGPGVYLPCGRFVATRLRPGDRVLLNPFWGSERTVWDQLVLFGREAEILSAIEDDDRTYETVWTAPPDAAALVEEAILESIKGVTVETLEGLASA